MASLSALRPALLRRVPRVRRLRALESPLWRQCCLLQKELDDSKVLVPTSVRCCASSASSTVSSTENGSSSSATRNQAPQEVERPSPEQMRAHFVSCAVPLVGFGFMDNTVMIHAGNAIDLTLGVTFGLSTLAAAACGQICSDVAGVSFGGLIDAAAGKLGLPDANLTEAQRKLPSVKRVGFAGSVIGVCCGCSLGLTNLFLIDTTKARELKLAASVDHDGPKFSVSMSNTASDECTAVTIEGPDIEGVIASVTTAMAVANCKIQEMSGDRRANAGHSGMCFTFYITQHGEQVEDDELENLARSFMEACNHPQRVQTLSIANQALRRENEDLQGKLLDKNHEHEELKRKMEDLKRDSDNSRIMVMRKREDAEKREGKIVS